jgi:hypothetical protein
MVHLRPETKEGREKGKCKGFEAGMCLTHPVSARKEMWPKWNEREEGKSDMKS